MPIKILLSLLRIIAWILIGRDRHRALIMGVLYYMYLKLTNHACWYPCMILGFLVMSICVAYQASTKIIGVSDAQPKECHHKTRECVHGMWRATETHPKNVLHF